MLPLPGTSRVMRHPQPRRLQPRGRRRQILLCLAATVAACYLVLAIAVSPSDHAATARVLAIARSAVRGVRVSTRAQLELATATSKVTATTLPTATPQSTATPVSTATPQPTATPLRIPTATPVPATATPQPIATPSTGRQTSTVSGVAILAIIGIILLVALLIMVTILLVRRNGPPPGGPDGPGAGTPPTTSAPPVGAPPVPPMEQQQPNVYRQVEWGQVREAQWQHPPASGLPPIAGQAESPIWTGSSSETTLPGSYDPGESNTPSEPPDGHN